MINYFSKTVSQFIINEDRTKWFLLIVISLFALLRMPSLIEPHWYGDEGIYQVVGRAILSGEILYKDIWDNKPPFLYLIYAIFNGELFFIKLASLITGLLSVFAFYNLSNYLFEKIPARFFSTLVYAVALALPIIEGNIANAENFMLLPILLSAIYIFKFLKSDKNKYLYIAGFLLSIAFITKIVAVFDFLAFFLFLILQKKNMFNFPNLNYKKIKPYVFFIVSFASLMLFSLVYFLSVGALGDFLRGVFSENVNYVNVNNDYFFPLGILFFKSIILFLVVFIILKKSKSLLRSERFLYLWFSFSLYNAFFSHRPYVHYLLVILPAFSLLIGIFFEENKRRYLNILLISITIFTATNYFTIYKKTFSYYLNYISFLTNNKSLYNYYEFFDARTPSDYEIANFINNSTSDEEFVFLWSDSAQIYALANKLPVGKYAVAYHITFYEKADKETIDAIENKKPRFIIQTAKVPMPRGILANYKFRYELDSAKIYEREI